MICDEGNVWLCVCLCVKDPPSSYRQTISWADLSGWEVASVKQTDIVTVKAWGSYEHTSSRHIAQHHSFSPPLHRLAVIVPSVFFPASFALLVPSPHKSKVIIITFAVRISSQHTWTWIFHMYNCVIRLNKNNKNMLKYFIAPIYLMKLKKQHTCSHFIKNLVFSCSQGRL